MIQKFLSGGGAPPFVYYQPVTVTQPSGTTAAALTAATTSKSSELSSKDLLKAFDKIDGLPSDMLALKDGLVTAINSGSDLFGGADSIFGSTDQIAGQYANTILGIKIANFSKKRYDEIKSTLDKNGGTNEVAVTSNGKIMVSDNEGNVQPIEVDEYLKNKGKYKPLTNSNILYMRAYGSSYANNDDWMNIASNGIGLTEINKQIKAALGHLGTSEASKDSYAVLQGVQAIKDLAEKTGGIKPEGLYKIKTSTSDQGKQAKAALNYIWGILPENAKTVLKVKAGGDKEAQVMIMNLIASGTTDKSEYSEKYELDAEGNKPGSKKSGKGDSSGVEKYKPGIVSNFVRGLGKKQSFVIMNGTKDGIQVNATMASLTNNAGKVGGPMSMQKAMQGGYNGVLDWQNVSIGGVHVSDAHLSELMCTDGNIYSIDCPSTTDKDGNIIPDYKLFAAKEAADKEVRQLGLEDTENPDYAKINAIYKKHNVPAKYNSEGNLISEHWSRFGVMNGVAMSKAFGEDQTFNNKLKEVNDKDLEGYLKYFNDEAKISGGQQASGKDVEFDKESLWDKITGFGGQHWWSTHDNMFQGTIFIPIKADVINAMGGDATKTYIGETEEIQGLLEDSDLQQSYNDPGGLDDDE